MKFKSIKIDYKNNSTVSINWDYLENEGSPNNFVVNIGVAETPYGPFQQIVEIPSSTTNYLYKKIPKKWLQLFFELTIFDKTHETINDTRVEQYIIESNVYIDKLKKKYKLYLKSKVKNDFLVFKRKRFGRHCLECWDQEHGRVKKDNCNTCYGTSYGNIHNYGLGSLSVDGFLKIGSTGYLELRKNGLMFDEYPFVTNQGGFPVGPDNKITKGDLFVLKTTNNETVFSAPILDVTKDALQIDSTDQSVFSLLQNTTFNIYRPVLQTESKKLQTKLIQIAATKFYLFDDRLESFALDSTVGLTTSNAVTFTATKFEAGLLLTIGSASTGAAAFRISNNFYLTDINGAVLQKLDLSIRFISLFDTEAYFEIIDPTQTALVIGDKFFSQFQYDGIQKFVLAGLEETIAVSNDLHTSYLIFNITNIPSPGVFTVAIDESKTYNRIDESELISNHSIYRIMRQNNFIESYKYLPCTALQRYFIRNDETPRILLEHKHILKTGFRGSGVLAIDLQIGKTYAAADYDLETDTYDDNGDFYFNPYTGELDLSTIPEALYEIKFIYETTDLTFDSFFLPLNPVFKNQKLSKVDGWIYKNINLIGKSIDITKNIFSIKSDSDYRELKIKTHTNDTLILESLEDPYLFWSAQNLKSMISIDLIDTGGYYDPVKISGTFRLTPSKTEEPIDTAGIRSSFMPVLLVDAAIILDNDDIIFDLKTKKFYIIYNINMPIFKGLPIYQELSISQKNWSESDRLFDLLERKIKFAY